jgi:hypothetical protein
MSRFKKGEHLHETVTVEERKDGKRPPLVSVARLTIHKGSAMSAQGRKDIAAWLRRQARDFDNLGNIYSDRFTARYLNLK